METAKTGTNRGFDVKTAKTGTKHSFDIICSLYLACRTTRRAVDVPQLPRRHPPEGVSPPLHRFDPFIFLAPDVTKGKNVDRSNKKPRGRPVGVSQVRAGGTAAILKCSRKKKHAHVIKI